MENFIERYNYWKKQNKKKSKFQCSLKNHFLIFHVLMHEKSGLNMCKNLYQDTSQIVSHPSIMGSSRKSRGKMRAVGEKAVFVRTVERMQQCKRKYLVVISWEEYIRGHNDRYYYTGLSLHPGGAGM